MRLTYKYENDNEYGSVALKHLSPDPFIDKMAYFDKVWKEERNKLGQLEDIEEELGIDLITLLKVQTIGAYFIDVDKKWIPLTDYNEKCFRLSDSKIYRFYFKDYGKTWALTKEELL